ncbi:sialate O-acetylesterase [Pedobacter gandavensis]|uniref:sialate O-acetylesterase n=1 Tax=Pedobacter gandavensis TaxID=2679963 RepID=UPI0029310391|nr:sialate O-acetylesterase [Pedobacter gandavensis]
MTLKHSYASITLLLAMVFVSLQGNAKITLAAVFSDNMVIQQKTTVAFWGKAAPGKQVNLKASWASSTFSTQSDKNGNWKIKLPTPGYGGPYKISISDGKTLQLSNVMLGDVWVCSGQSNMKMPLADWGKINNYQQEIKDANYPNIRLLQVQHRSSNVPLKDVGIANAGWRVCNPENIAGFSATAYFFARTVYQKTGIPIGLIHASWGSSVAEAWMSAATLKSLPDITKTVEKLNPAKKELSYQQPTVLYNAMIYPFLDFAIKGVIWYQGESNAERAHQYRTLFPALINDWRKSWGIGDFPFYFVQLPYFMKRDLHPGPSLGAELRDAQLGALKLKNTGMAVTIDIGNELDIHPKNKQEVGRRLALVALANIYGKKIPFSGPVLKSYTIDKDLVKLNFRAVHGGLKTKDNATLRGFSIAGADQVFHWAKASIHGDRIILSSPEVMQPKAIRYGWSNNPGCNLYNKAGLPAAPFRTDNWEDSTKP